MEKNQDISNIEASKAEEIMIGDVKLKLKYGFKAWAILKKKYGTIKNIIDIMREPSTDEISYLIFSGVLEPEGISEERIVELLDNYNIIGITKILGNIRSILWGSLPKDEGKKNPPVAEKR